MSTPYLETSLLLVLLAAAPMPASAFGLLEGFRLAQRNDAAYRAAQAEREAGEANRALGRAQLLPVISASVSRSSVKGEREIAGSTTDLDYTSKSAALQLRQPLFNMERWASYQQGMARADFSQSVFSRKEKDLTVRYVNAYLDLLLAEQTVVLIETKLAALKEARIQAQRRFEQGDGTVIDVREAEARMAISEAQLSEAQNLRAVAEGSLVLITGQSPQRLAEPGAEIGKHLGPAGLLPEWLARASQNSPEVQAAQKKVAIAEQELRKARAEHYPSLDLVASHSRTSSETVSTLNQKNTLTAVGVQLSVPLFSGGHASALSEQAGASLRQSLAELDGARSQAALEVSRQFYGFSSSTSKVAALQKAVLSSQEALTANKRGVVAGVRTGIDVLNAEEQLYQARYDLVQAAYVQLVSWIGLRAYSGLLTEEDIIQLDQGFVARR